MQKTNNVTIQRIKCAKIRTIKNSNMRILKKSKKFNNSKKRKKFNNVKILKLYASNTI